MARLKRNSHSNNAERSPVPGRCIRNARFEGKSRNLRSEILYRELTESTGTDPYLLQDMMHFPIVLLTSNRILLLYHDLIQIPIQTVIQALTDCKILIVYEDLIRTIDHTSLTFVFSTNPPRFNV